MYILLYADDTVIFAESKEELQSVKNLLKWPFTGGNAYRVGPDWTTPLGAVWSGLALDVQFCFRRLGSLRLVSVDSDCRFILVFFEAFFKVFCVLCLCYFMFYVAVGPIPWLGVLVLNKNLLHRRLDR